MASVKEVADELWLSFAKGTRYLSENGIGWYNPEQQADDFVAEILDSVGIDPKLAVDHWADYAAQTNEKNLNTEELTRLGYPLPVSCRVLAKAGFRDTQGNWLPVKLSKDWNDSHHGFCYRAYNIAREIAFHGYKTDSRNLPEFLSMVASRWKSIQKLAQEQIP